MSEKTNIINRAKTKLDKLVVKCPMGKLKTLLVPIETTCKLCPNFKGVEEADEKKERPMKVHCIIPTKYYTDVVAIENIEFPKE